jgi:SAM-dependent methyltransferase
MLRGLVHRVGRAYIGKVTTAEVADQVYRRSNERPVEYAFAFSWLNRSQPKSVLDVGTGKSAWPSLLRTCGFVVTASDNVRDYWSAGMVNRHWHVVDDDIQQSRLPQGSFDAITCISVLEHVTDPLRAVASMRGLLRPGGTLVLTTPFGASGHPNVYTEPDSYGRPLRYPCRQSSPGDLAAWCGTGLVVRGAEYWRANTSQWWSCGELVRPLQPSPEPAQLGCFALERT